MSVLTIKKKRQNNLLSQLSILFQKPQLYNFLSKYSDWFKITDIEVIVAAKADIA